MANDPNYTERVTVNAIGGQPLAGNVPGAMPVTSVDPAPTPANPFQVGDAALYQAVYQELRAVRAELQALRRVVCLATQQAYLPVDSVSLDQVNT